MRRVIFYVIAIVFLAFSMPFINFDVSYANYLTIINNDIKSFTLRYCEPNRYVRQYFKIRENARDLKFGEIKQLEKDIKGFNAKYLLGDSYLNRYVISNPKEIEEYGFELYPNYINEYVDGGIVIPDKYAKECYELGDIEGLKEHYENDIELYKDMINKEIHGDRIIGVFKMPSLITDTSIQLLYFECSDRLSTGHTEFDDYTITLKTNLKEIDIDDYGYIGNRENIYIVEDTDVKDFPIPVFTMSKDTFKELFDVDINNYISSTSEGKEQIVKIPEQFYYDYEVKINYNGYLYPDNNLDNIIYPLKSNMNMVLFGVYDTHSSYGNSIRFNEEAYTILADLFVGYNKLYATNSFEDLNYVLHKLYGYNITPYCDGLHNIQKAECSYFFYLISFGIFISLVILGIIIKYRKNIINNIKNYKKYLLPNIVKIIIYTLSLTIILSLLALVFCYVVTICYNNMFTGWLGIDPYASILPFSITNILYFFIEGLLGSTLYFLVKSNNITCNEI